MPLAQTDRPPIRVALVDDHPRMLSQLRQELSQEPDIQIVAEGGSGADLERIMESNSLDVLVLDLHLPLSPQGDPSLGRFATVTGIRRLLSSRPNVQVVIFSGETEPYMISAVLEVGCLGYVVKNDPDNLAPIIRQVAQGQRYLSKTAQRSLDTRQSLDEESHSLSERELDVLWFLARESSYKAADIATALYISLNTVNRHINSLYTKLGVRRRTEATDIARRLNLIRPPSR